MTTKAVLEKLMEVEQALRNRDFLAAHVLVFQTQEALLQMEREMIEEQALKLSLPADVHPGIASGWSARAVALRSTLEGAPPEDDSLHAFAFLPGTVIP